MISKILGGWLWVAIVCCCLFPVVTPQPYVTVDWSAADFEVDDPDIEGYTVDYLPNVGKPPPPIRLPASLLQTEISDTLPATMYTVAIIAEYSDKRRSIIYNSTLPSSPEPPLVDTIDTKASEVLIQLFPPDSDDITYLANYSLSSNPDIQFSKSFTQSSIALDNLNAGSEYNIFIFTLFNGIYSHRPSHLTVRTLSPFTNGHVSLIVSSPSPNIPSTSPLSSMSTTVMETTAIESTTVPTTQHTTDLQTSTSHTETSTLSISLSPRIITLRPLAHSARLPSIKQSTGGSSWKPMPVPIVRRPSVAALEPIEEGTKPPENPKEATEIPVGREQPDGDEEGIHNEEIDHSEEPRPQFGSSADRKDTEVIKSVKEDTHNPKPASFNFSLSLPPEILIKLPDSYGRPKSVEFSPEGRQLRVSWQRPDGIDCSGYFVNYTLTSLHVPKSFQLYIDSDRTYALIKMYFNNTIQVEVHCINNDTIVSKTPGLTTVDLRKPEPVKNLRIANLLTDDFFRSSVQLLWDWPANFSYDADMYSIVISYYPGKAKKVKSQTLVVNETGPVNITGLKPTETYTFSVVNISKLNIESSARGFKQIMPPVIASTLLPGQVTSTSLLITYSPTDVDEARFDSYQLLACFSDSVNKTFVKSKADPNRNFLLKNLIPGQTYAFYLYTVYRKVRSKPVVANFTTYPLKVKNLFGIVRRNAVKLFYEPEESPLKEIRYKLSFTGSDGSESDSVTLLNQREYVFDYLKPEIWYTFSVTVLMGDQESESAARTIVTGFNSDPVPHLRGSTPTTIDIAFRRDLFTESNGIIQNYSIIVSEDYRLDYFNYSVLSWRAVQNFEVWPPYRATPNGYNPFKNPNDEAITYTIGIETCNVDGLDEYCNGPLKPRTEYFIKLRACTNEHICMETSYTKAATEIDAASLETRRFLNPRFNNGGRYVISRCVILVYVLLCSLRYAYSL